MSCLAHSCSIIQIYWAFTSFNHHIGLLEPWWISSTSWLPFFLLLLLLFLYSYFIFIVIHIFLAIISILSYILFINFFLFCVDLELQCQVFEEFTVFASDYAAFIHACDRCRLVNWKWVECTYGILDQDCSSNLVLVTILSDCRKMDENGESMRIQQIPNIFMSWCSVQTTFTSRLVMFWVVTATWSPSSSWYRWQDSAPLLGDPPWIECLGKFLIHNDELYTNSIANQLLSSFK